MLKVNREFTPDEVEGIRETIAMEKARLRWRLERDASEREAGGPGRVYRVFSIAHGE